MLIELWEKLRGYDKWVEAQATVAELKIQKGEIDFKADCKIEWDGNGKKQTSSFQADEESPLYQLSEGDQFSIRVNPQEPSEFYSAELIASDILAARKAILWGLMIILVVIAFFLPDVLVRLHH